MSLKNLNGIIKNNKNKFLLETKADILLSYGYTEEAIKFYELVLKKYPNNKYVQLKILNNIDQIKFRKEKINLLFYSNLNLLLEFPNYRLLYLKYRNLSELLEKNQWISFFNLYELKKNYEINEFNNQIKRIINTTDDKDLMKFLKAYMEINK